MAIFSPSIHKEQYVCFKIINHLSPFSEKFVLLLLFNLYLWKSYFCIVPGKPNKVHMETLLLISWNKKLYISFLNWIFWDFWSKAPYFSGQREYNQRILKQANQNFQLVWVSQVQIGMAMKQKTVFICCGAISGGHLALAFLFYWCVNGKEMVPTNFQ